MRSKSFKLLMIMIAIGVIIFALHIALKYISVIVYQEKHAVFFELSNRFDMNDENSVPQWFTLVGWLVVTGMAMLASYLAKKKSERRLWGTIGVIALLLSVDDAAAVHESLLGVLHGSIFDDAPATLTRNAWLLLLPFVLVTCVWLLIKAVRLLPLRTTVNLTVGAAIFLIGAIFVDSFTNTLPVRSFAGQGVGAGIEGWLQLIGLAILIYAITDHLERQHGATIATALKQLKV